MNGAQDLGGMDGFGQVQPEPNEPVFHAEWEKRAFALTLAMGMPGGWNIDMSRFARENRPPGEYLAMSYYQLWFAALEAMMKQRGLIADDEIDAGHSLHPPKPVKRALSPADVAKTLHRGGPTERETNTVAKFKPGNRVRTKNINPVTHTRLPRYIRGHLGQIERRRKSAVALHRALRRPRIVGPGWRSDRDGLGRCLGAVLGAGLIVRLYFHHGPRSRPPPRPRLGPH
jgi:nitrile hydratase beta subunit